MKQLLQRNKAFLRFLVCGGMSTGIDFIVYMVLSQFLDVSVSKLISMCCACIFSFFVNKYWTFKDKKNVTLLQVLRFIGAQAVNIGVNVGTNWLALSLSGSKILAFVAATGTAMLVNYSLQKLFVFQSEKSQ